MQNMRKVIEFQKPARVYDTILLFNINKYVCYDELEDNIKISLT